MSKQEQAMELICLLGFPKEQQNERSALTLLALADVGPDESWSEAKQPLLRILDMMRFMKDKYGKEYAPNSRETIRRQTIHQFEQARIIDRNPDDPKRSTNSGKTCYALTDEILPVVQAYGTPAFNKKVKAFIKLFGDLESAYRKQRALHQVTLKLPDGSEFQLSPGQHNNLQADIINEFGPRFAAGAVVLYVGDTAKKQIVCETEQFATLGIEVSEHDKLPDIVLHEEKRNWLYLIEAVTSHGPVNPKRHAEIELMMENGSAERVYVTAFPDKKLFRQYCADIAWETEVWIADNPDHLIHFNGDKFLGPYREKN